MEDEECDSDSTVLLTDYFDKPEKIDAKRRRLSNLHDKIHADKHEGDNEQENTAPDGAGDDSRTNDKRKQKNNVDKNLLINKYLAGLSEVKNNNNEQLTFPVTTKVTKEIEKELDFDNGRNLKRNDTNSGFDDDIICLDSDDETQIHDENVKNQNVNLNDAGVHKVYGDNNNITESKNKYANLNVLTPAAINARRATINVFERSAKNQNMNLNNAGVHKVYGDNNNLTESKYKYGKLKVLKPAAINARRATINVFERSVLVDNYDGSFRVDKNKTDATEAMRPSVIITRRASTSFEENCNAINEKTIEVVETSTVKNTNLRNKNITVQSYNTPFTSNAISVDTKNLNSNPNKRFSNEDKIPSEPKRLRIETTSKCTQHYQYKNNTHNNENVSCKLTDTPDKNEMGEKIENKKTENFNSTNSEQEKAEAYKVPKTSLEGLKSETLRMVVQQESIRLQDKGIKRVVQGVEQACDFPGTNKVQDQQEISAILVQLEMSTVPNDQVTNDSHDNLHDNPETNVVPDEQEICRSRNEEVINKSHNEPENLKLQDKQEISVVPCEQEICKARNEEIINKSHNNKKKPELEDKQKISAKSDEHDTGKVGNEQVINESQQKQKKTKVQGEQEISRARNEDVHQTKNPELQDKEEISVVSGEHRTDKVDNEQVIHKSLQKQKKTEVQGVPEMCIARYEEVINVSHDKHKKTKVQRDQEIHIVQDEQEISRARIEEAQQTKNLELQDRQEKSVVSGEHRIDKVDIEQVIHKSHQKQKKTKVQGKQEKNTVQDDHEICKANNQQEINESYDKQDKCKVQRKQEISTTQGEHVISETCRKHKQGTSKIQKKQIINEAYNDQKRYVVRDDDNSITHDSRGTGDVQDKEVISDDDELKADKLVQHIRRTSKAHTKQETKEINDEHKTNEALNVSEKNERNEITHKLCPGWEKKHIHKFQVQFFTVVKKFIQKGYPESAMVLHNLIQTLKTHAMNGIVQTDIKYSCPQCKQVSSYSSSFLNNTDPEENIATADFQKCRLCQTLTKLHISYMKKFLKVPEEISEDTAQNKVKNTVATNYPPLCNDKSSIGEVKSNMPTTNNPETIAKVPKEPDTAMSLRKETIAKVPKEPDTAISLRKETIAKVPKEPDTAMSLRKETIAKVPKEPDTAMSLRKETIAKVPKEPDTAMSLRKETIAKVPKVPDTAMSLRKETIAKVPKEPDTAMSLRKETSSQNMNILKEKDVCEQPKPSYVNVETLPKNDPVITKKRVSSEYMIDSKRKKLYAEHNYAQHLTDCENMSDTQTNNLQTKTTNDENILDPGLKATSNLFSVAISEECSENENKKATDHVNEVASEKASTSLTNEDVERYKSGDNISGSGTSARSGNENDSDPNMATTNSKEKVNANEITLKSLEDTFTKLKHNTNTVKTVNEKAKEQQENNTVTPVSASNRNNRLDIQPNCNINTRTDVQYICRFCSCKYDHVSKLLRHMRMNHNVKDTKILENCVRRKCVFCNEYLDHKNYNKHVKKNHPEKFTENVATNENSDINEDGSGIMKNDMNKTSDSSTYRYHCSICEEIFCSYYASRQHRTEKHPELRNQQICKKVIIKGKDEQDEVNNENEESSAEDNTDSELEDDTDAVTSAKNIDRHCSTNHKKVHHSEGNEAGFRKDTNNKQQARADESGTTSAKIVGSNENSNMYQESSDDITTRDTLKYKYHCSICNEILSNYYASRQHRKQRHPEFRYQPIYKKVIIKDKDKDKIHDDDNEQIDVEENVQDTSDESEGEGEVVTSVKEVNRHDSTNYKQIREKKEISRNDANNSEINETISEASKFKFHCSVCDEILNNDYASRQHRKQKHPKLKRRQIYKKVVLKNKEEQDVGEISSSDYSDLDDNEESASDANDERNEDCDVNELDDTSNDNNVLNTKRFKHACVLCKEIFPSYYVARKHRMDKHPNMSGAYLIKKILEDATTSKDQSSNKKEKNQSSSNESSSSSDNEKEGNSDDEVIKASHHTIKNKRDHIVKVFGNEKEASARPEINEKTSTPEVRREHRDDQLRTEHKEIENINTKSANNCSEIEDAHASEDESLKVSERTAKKKKERITKLFGDDSNVTIQPNKTDCDQELAPNNNGNKSNLKPTDDVSETKDAHFSEENVERENNDDKCGTDMSYHQNANETYINKNDRNCNKATDASELAINGKNKTDQLNNAETKFQDDDRIEIDMIDCFLEELNSEPSEIIQKENLGDKNNDNPASQISDGKIQNNEEYQYHIANLSVEVHEETCLDNVKITNVTSIADKLYVYVCQECFYATDAYDIVIRHCQNHYNNIEDPVIFCNSCQIKYDVPCFERHESSHDKYLKSVKINFSYEWLFANWQRVFENNDMVLTDAEDMQVKSIYKTFCVKMAVKQDGPWQTSLYLCCKCNTCVPPQDIESHVQHTCQFMNGNSCSVCNYAFLTDDMRMHHEIYHKGDASKLFKMIVFNDKDDDIFNLKLFKAKAIVKNEGHQRVTDIFKCICGLCFISLKKLKLHFIECEELTNNGIDCPECTVLRRFLPTELTAHRSLHHGTVNYEFKVQQIGFQEETNNNNTSEAVCNSDAEKKNGPPAEIEDLKVNDMLKDEILTQISNEDGSQRHPESVECIEEDLTDKRDMSKDESLTQNSNDNDCQGYPQNVELNEEDLAVKREMLKDETLTQISNEDESQRHPEPVECITEDLTDKRDMSKGESLTRISNDNDGQGYPENVELNEEDLAVKREMLKDEILTQTTNKDSEQSDLASVGHNEENFVFETDILNDEKLTQTTNKDVEQRQSVELAEENLSVESHTLNESLRNTDDSHNQSNTEPVAFDEDLAVTHKLKDESLKQAANNVEDPELVELSDNEDDVVNEKVNSQDIMDVDDSEPPIPIDSDSDSDIEFVCSNLLS